MIDLAMNDNIEKVFDEYFDYSVVVNTVSHATLETMKSWCSDRYGERWASSSDRMAIGDPAGKWRAIFDPSVLAYRWYFKHEHDLLLFRLRWGM